MSRLRRGGRPPVEVTLENERRAWELRQQGLTQEAISKEMGLPRVTVTKTLGRVSRRILAELQDDISRVKMEQVAQLEYVVAESFGAWEKSKQMSRSVRQRKVIGSGKNGDSQEESVSASERYGDPKLFETALRAMRDIRLILGIEQPGARIVMQNFSASYVSNFLSDEERAERIAILLAEAERHKAEAAGQIVEGAVKA